MSTGVNMHNCCLKGMFLNWLLTAKGMLHIIGRLIRINQTQPVVFHLLLNVKEDKDFWVKNVYYMVEACRIIMEDFATPEEIQKKLTLSRLELWAEFRARFEQGVEVAKKREQDDQEVANRLKERQRAVLERVEERQVSNEFVYDSDSECDDDEELDDVDDEAAEDAEHGVKRKAADEGRGSDGQKKQATGSS